MLAIVFWDRNGVLLNEFIIADVEKVWKSIKKKRQGLITQGVILLLDVVHPHTAANANALLEQFKLTTH